MLIQMTVVYIVQQKDVTNELKEQGDKMIADKSRLKFINENMLKLNRMLND